MLSLLKLLFILLAALWLYRALQPVLFSLKPPAPPPPARGPETRIVQKNRPDDEGEYVDYEEIK